MAESKLPDYIGHRARLRTRFINNEGKDFADYELLELLLTYALPRQDVKPLAKELIRKFGSFAGVISAPISDLVTVSGLKENSAILLKVVKSAATLLSWQQLQNEDAPIISSWDIMIDYCRTLLAYCEVEEFHVIYLNAKLQVIKQEIMQKGTINMVAFHPREVLKSAIANNASGIILLHNHPSGSTRPSNADITLTQQIVEAAEAINIAVIDHIIVSKNETFSFQDSGLITRKKDIFKS